MAHRYDTLDWDIITERRDQCCRKERMTPWAISPDTFLAYSQILPTSEKTAELYEQMNHGLELGAGIEQYLDVHGKDPHLLQPLLKFREVVKKTGFDPNYDITTAQNLKPYFLIAFATGDGQTLHKLINYFQPHHLVIALADWQDFATSFWFLNWQEISNNQYARGGSFSIGSYQDSDSLLSFLGSESLAGIDHAVLYNPPEGAASPKALALREGITSLKLNNSVSYLGYTIDEHNMVWNTWQTLAKGPKIFSKPECSVGGKMVVCGSGPSIDENLLDLKELSRTHLITACGSNIRTLMAHDIRVDFLVLVEREDEVFAITQEVVSKYGSKNIRLLMSTTCHAKLQDLYKETMVFFRPALTPLAIFSNSPSEVLNFEGPESINTGIAFASAIGVDELVLVGVDLGSRSLEKIRSSDAVGSSEREFDMEAKANFGGLAYTSRLLRDSRLSAEVCMRCYPDTNVINASDGVFIEGATPCRLDDIVGQNKELPTIPTFESSSIGKWWNTSLKYTPERFLSSWKSRRPRAESSLLISQLNSIFDPNTPWNPTIIHSVTQLLSLDTIPSRQFPRRLLRSTIHKLIIAANRQLIVMASEPQKSHIFEQEVKHIMRELLVKLETELYQLCDAVEALPIQP